MHQPVYAIWQPGGLSPFTHRGVFQARVEAINATGTHEGNFYRLIFCDPALLHEPTYDVPKTVRECDMCERVSEHGESVWQQEPEFHRQTNMQTMESLTGGYSSELRAEGGASFQLVIVASSLSARVFCESPRRL